jgi:hypothetical protein
VNGSEARHEYGPVARSAPPTIIRQDAPPLRPFVRQRATIVFRAAI